jgi:tetraacyldisaccharide 4'-kinase
MQFNKPQFWDLKKPNILSNLLLPFTILLKLSNFLLARKNKIYNKKIFSICLGNIYLGGTGKTPTTIYLYKILKKLNRNTFAAKKYYLNQKDEQIILKKETKLIIGKTRKEIFNIAIRNKNKVLIFDDGLQDRDVEYNLKFVCFDSDSLIGNGRLIPSGPLRENLESLKKYDGIFIKEISHCKTLLIKKIKKINPKIKIFKTMYKIKNFKSFNLKDKYLIFSGIGNNTGFKKILIKNKFKIIKEIFYPDHYHYKRQDIEYIKDLSKKINAKIITTEKDYVKINKLDNKNINFLKIDLKIKDKKRLINFIKKHLYEWQKIK